MRLDLFITRSATFSIVSKVKNSRNSGNPRTHAYEFTQSVHVTAAGRNLALLRKSYEEFEKVEGAQNMIF